MSAPENTVDDKHSKPTVQRMLELAKDISEERGKVLKDYNARIAAGLS